MSRKRHFCAPGWIAAAIVLARAANAEAQADAPASVAPSVQGYGDLQIEAPLEFAPAAEPHWIPRDDSEPTLSHARGEGLSAAWVKRQFIENGLVGPQAPARPAEIAALVQRINRAYLENGYINSGLRIEADSGDGVLHLRLVSGSVDQPIVVWRDGNARGLDAQGGYVRDRLPALETHPFNAAALERQFRLLAEDPAIETVNANLRPQDVAGFAAVDLEIAPAPRFDLSLHIANDRAPSVGGERAALAASMRHGAVDGDLLEGEIGLTEGLYDAMVRYEAPFLHPRLRLLLRADVNEADVIDPALAVLDIRSDSQGGEIGFAYALVQRPLLRPGAEAERPARRVSLGARVSHKQTKTFLLGAPFSFSPGAVDGRSEVDTARLSADWIARSSSRVWAASVVASFGLDGTGTDIAGALSPDPHFRTLQAQLNFAQRLGPALELRARLSTQIADGLLYASERFALGGATTVRGYRENLLLADSGAIASFELTRRLVLSKNPAAPADIALSLFVDAGAARNERGLSPSPDQIASLGVGALWRPNRGVEARIAFAHALTDVRSAGARDVQDDGIHAEIRVRPLRWFRRSA